MQLRLSLSFYESFLGLFELAGHEVLIYSINLVFTSQFAGKMPDCFDSGASEASNAVDLVGPVAAFAVPLFILCILFWFKYCKKSDKISAGDITVLIMFSFLAISGAIWLAVTIMNSNRTKSSLVASKTTTNATILNEAATSCTVSGPDSPKPCVFPFIWKKVIYHECTKIDHSQPWCPTETKNGCSVAGKWGNCGECPHDQTSDSTTIATSTEKNTNATTTSTMTTATSSGARTSVTSFHFTKYNQTFDEAADTCTLSGPDKYKPCVFPFIWNKFTYHECTAKDNDQPWCSTETINDQYVSQKWGNCGTCPSLTSTKSKELFMLYNISRWNLPRSHRDCLQMGSSNDSYPTFIDSEYRRREAESGNMEECWSFLLNPVEYLNRYFDKTLTEPRSKEDCDMRLLVRRMDFSNEKWFHYIPRDRRGDKMYLCKEHFRRREMKQCNKSNVVFIVPTLIFSVPLCGLLLFLEHRFPGKFSSANILGFIVLWSFVVFLVILFLAQSCTDTGLFSFISSIFSSLLGLVLRWFFVNLFPRPCELFYIPCPRRISTENQSSGPRGTQDAQRINVYALGSDSASAPPENEATAQASSKDSPPSYNQATLPSYSEATEMQCEKF